MKDGRFPVSADVDASGLRVAIVASRWNEDVTSRLLAGARAALLEHGATEDDITVVMVPGAFELPVVAEALARAGSHDVIVALGAVIRGETPHFDYVATAATDGLAATAREHGIPVGFGLLTTDTLEQALARAGGEAGDKGAEAALSAVEVATTLRTI